MISREDLQRLRESMAKARPSDPPPTIIRAMTVEDEATIAANLGNIEVLRKVVAQARADAIAELREFAHAHDDAVGNIGMGTLLAKLDKMEKGA